MLRAAVVLLARFTVLRMQVLNVDVQLWAPSAVNAVHHLVAVVAWGGSLIIIPGSHSFFGFRLSLGYPPYHLGLLPGIELYFVELLLGLKHWLEVLLLPDAVKMAVPVRLHPIVSNRLLCCLRMLRASFDGKGDNGYSSRLTQTCSTFFPSSLITAVR